MRALASIGILAVGLAVVVTPTNLPGVFTRTVVYKVYKYRRGPRYPGVVPDDPTPGKEVGPHEYYGWKFASARLAGAMKEWKDAWEADHPNPTGV